MGVIMGKIIMNNSENQTQLILQAGDEESLKRQVDGIDMLERKAKAFDEILKVDNQATDEDRLTGEYESNIETIIGDYMEDE